MKSLIDLLEGLQYKKVTGLTDININSIEQDSRLCNEGSLFVAIRGGQFDGHNFIDDVISRGTKAVVCEKYEGADNLKDDVTFITVPDTRAALAIMAHNFFGNPTKDMKVIGVTGTNGKTTITFLLKSLLDSAGYSTGIIGTTGIFFGNETYPATHTTPDPLQLCGYFAKMKSAGVQTVVMEVSSHALHQHRINGIKFDAALFTNLTHDHLDYHKTMEDYALAKKILFDMLDSDGMAIVNGDDDYSEYMLKDTKAGNKIRIGRRSSNDIGIINESLHPDYSDFSLLINGEKYDFRTGLIGRFNIDNAAIAAAVCIGMGIEIEKIISCLAKAHGATGRMQKIILNNRAVALVDYAHTPDALEKALKSCRDVMKSSGNANNKLICVFGCGGDRDKEKRPVMGRLSAKIADYVILTDDNPRTEDSAKIIQNIFYGIDKEDKQKVIQISSRAEAIAYACGIAKENDIILIAGKGHENYQIIGKERLHFNDAEELEMYK
jgi:UDP-N-acetylmuramoyl-L-alanyl-D-glutamate--2,6-diaminopimelate ligase